MVKKVSKFPLFLVGILVFVVLSAFVVLPSLAVDADVVYNGDFESALGVTGWSSVGEGQDFEVLTGYGYLGNNASSGCIRDYYAYDAFAGSNIYQLFDVEVEKDDFVNVTWAVRTVGDYYITLVLGQNVSGPNLVYSEVINTGGAWENYVFDTVAYLIDGESVESIYFGVSALGGSTYLYLDDIGVMVQGGGTPTTPPSTPSDDSDSDVIDSLVQVLLPLTVILIPAFLLGLAAKLGTWGYMVGIAIGTGLGYMLLPAPYTVPLWMVFLVGIAEFGMIYKGRGGG